MIGSRAGVAAVPFPPRAPVMFMKAIQFGAWKGLLWLEPGGTLTTWPPNCTILPTCVACG